MPAEDNPTNVLFNNNRVELVTPEELKKLAISRAKIKTLVRFLTANETFLEDIGLNVNSIYDVNVCPELTLGTSPPSDDSKTYALILDQIKTTSLLRATQAHRDAKVFTAPQFTLLDGDKGGVGIHGRNAVEYRSGYSEPNRPFDKSETRMDSFKANYFLVKPKLSLDNKYIDLDFQSKILLPLSADFFWYKYAHEDPHRNLVTTKAHCQLPNGQTLLIAGKNITVKEDGRKTYKTLIILLKAEKVVPEN
jgi:hypothetical protein